MSERRRSDVRRKRASMREVADLADVAISSVSRVLSGHPDVSVDMRDRVLNAVNQLEYEPDFLAQSLRRGATLSVGQVGARCENGFLMINGVIPPLGPYVLPGNNYHVYDYALFWGSIRADVERRLGAFRG